MGANVNELISIKKEKNNDMFEKWHTDVYILFLYNKRQWPDDEYNANKSYIRFIRI